MPIQIKRVYEPYTANDGCRILVDRLWPRGIKKETARIDKWLKEAAPSNTLRQWFNHEPEKFQVFIQKYHKEIQASAALKELHADIIKHKTITLLYSAKDELHNQAVALLMLLKEKHCS